MSDEVKVLEKFNENDSDFSASLPGLISGAAVTRHLGTFETDKLIPSSQTQFFSGHIFFFFFFAFQHFTQP